MHTIRWRSELATSRVGRRGRRQSDKTPGIALPDSPMKHCPTSSVSFFGETMRLKITELPQLTIEPGVVIDAPNTSWQRKFEVVKRVEDDQIIGFLCKWTEPNPDTSLSHCTFDHFGAGVVKGTQIVDAWPILTYDGNMAGHSGKQDVTVEIARKHLDHFKCPGCGAYVQMQRRTKRIGPEAALITRTCPKCRYQDQDVFD